MGTGLVKPLTNYKNSTFCFFNIFFHRTDMLDFISFKTFKKTKIRKKHKSEKMNSLQVRPIERHLFFILEKRFEKKSINHGRSLVNWKWNQDPIYHWSKINLVILDRYKYAVTEKARRGLYGHFPKTHSNLLNIFFWILNNSH